MPTIRKLLQHLVQILARSSADTLLVKEGLARLIADL